MYGSTNLQVLFLNFLHLQNSYNSTYLQVFFKIFFISTHFFTQYSTSPQTPKFYISTTFFFFFLHFYSKKETNLQSTKHPPPVYGCKKKLRTFSAFQKNSYKYIICLGQGPKIPKFFIGSTYI